MEIDDSVVWNRASASQVKTFSDCNRKWWFESVARLRDDEEEKEHLVTGTKIHSAIEQWLLGEDGAVDEEIWKIVSPVFDYGSWLTEQLAEFELAGGELTDEQVEVEFTLDKPFVLPVKGFIDVLLIDDERIHVIDHKSTKNFRYMLSAKALKKDPQAVIYCAAARELFGKRGRVEFSHHVIHKKGGGIRSTTISFTDEELDAAVDALNEKLLTMSKVGLFRDSDDVSTTRTSCGMYGGCPFAGSVCSGSYSKDTLDGFEGIVITKSFKESETMSAMDQLLGMSKTNKPAASKPTVYVNCFPMGVQYITMDLWAREEIGYWETANGGMPYLSDHYNGASKDIGAGLVLKLKNDAKGVPEHLVIHNGGVLGGILESYFRANPEKANLVVAS